MVISIDLKRNPDVADLLSGLEMGDKVKFFTSLKSNNGELAEFTLDKADECNDSDMKEHYSDEESDDEDQAEIEGTEQKRHSKMPAPGGSPNTPGGSRDQDRMAAALTAQI